MITRRNYARLSLSALAIAGFAALTACGSMSPSSNMVALSTQMRGANEVPPKAGNGTGSVDAVFNKETNLLRWKVSYTGLSGPATAGHFHGPADIGANAGVALGWPGAISSPMEGSATLTAAQAADLLAGKWYANIHTAANPPGEIRGQMTVRN
ncbi:MAG: CHRD domain-containing protein [Pseudomonadota bacterium]